MRALLGFELQSELSGIMLVQQTDIPLIYSGMCDKIRAKLNTKHVIPT